MQAGRLHYELPEAVRLMLLTTLRRLVKLFSRRSEKHCNRARLRSYRPWFDTLEDRCLLAALAPAGLVSWWRGENNSNDFVDGNNGSPHALYVAGKVGQAFSFDGSGDHIEASGAGSLN